MELFQRLSMCSTYAGAEPAAYRTTQRSPSASVFVSLVDRIRMCQTRPVVSGWSGGASTVPGAG
nr:hypothetical protein [Streptomyces californicus]